MKRFFTVMDGVAVLFLAVVLFAIAAAQPQPGDTTGIVIGTPNTVGGWLIALVQIATAALSTFYTAKLLGKWPFFDGWFAVFGTTAIGGVFIGLAGLLSTKLGFETGLVFSWKALLTFVAASAWYHYKKDQAKTVPPPA